MATALLLAGLYFGRRESSTSLTSEQSPAPTHRQVTFLGNVLGSAISPDGEVIAYASRFERGDDRLFVQDLAGGEPLEIGRYDEVGRIRWSPSGQTLAVNTAVGTQVATLLLPRMGGSSRLVKEKWGWFDWSPDGRQLVTSSVDKRLRFFEISTGDTTSVALPDSYTWCNDLDWSPHGDRIAYLTFAEPSRYSIWTIGAGGDGARRVVEDTIPVWAPRWSGLGEAIYYLRWSGETTELVRLEISPTSGEGVPPPRVILAGWDIADFSLSEDGNRMLYSRDQTESNIWLVSPRASADPEVEPLTTGTAWKSSFSLSPDGRHIALSMGSPNSNIHVQPIDGGTMKQLTYLQGRNDNPAWSPDGSEIVFGSKHGGRNQVWKVSAGGGTPRTYSETEVSESFQMTWAPGEKILYQQPGNRNFDVLDPETGAERSLVSNERVGWMFDPIYSPDGTKVAVLWNRPPDPGVWSISQDGEEQVLVSERADVTPVGWSPDGESIYGYRRDTSEVVRYSTTNRSAVVVATVECGSYVRAVRMTPDKKRFLCLGEESRSDLWIAEGFDPTVKATPSQ